MKMDLKSEDDDGDVPVELCIKVVSSFYLSPQGLNLILRYSDYTCAY